MKTRNKTAFIIEKGVTILFALIVVYLLALTTFTTATMDIYERTTLLAEHTIEKVLAMVAFSAGAVGIGCFLRTENRKKRLSDSWMDRAHTLLLATLGLFAMLFVLAAQKTPNVDQYRVINAASKWRNHDYSDFSNIPIAAGGGYLNLFPHQCGIVLIYYFLSFLLGQNNYVALQLLNPIFQVLLAKIMGDLTVEMTGDKKTSIFVDLAFLAFLPLTLFGTFVYGNLEGLTLSMAALAQAVKLRRDGRIIRILRCALCMLAALFFKENCLIFGIALAVYLGISFLRSRERKLLVAMGVVICILGFQGTAVRGMTRLITGQETGKGTSMWSYVQMRLMENDILYDGWWNQYNQDTFEETGFDSAAQEIRVKQDLTVRVDELKRNPQKALRFFAGKNASQWANPDFGSVWKNETMEPLTEKADSAGWVYWLISLESRAPFRIFMGAVQTAVLFGVLLSLLLSGSGRGFDFFLKTAFVGGFLFHTVWEAKGQYILSYFVLLLPLAVQGYALLAGLAGASEVPKTKRSCLIAGLGCFAFLLLLIQFGNIALLQELFKPWQR